MKTESRRMINVNKTKLKFGFLNISSNKTAELCPDSTTCCFPMSNGRLSDANSDLKLTDSATTGVIDKVKDSGSFDETNIPHGSIYSRHKGLLLLGTVGTILIAIASAIYVINPIQVIINTKLAFDGESYLFNMWQKPPVKVYVKVFIFNVTNPSEFLAGAKLKVEEVGPFVYREELEHTRVTFNSNNSVTYVPRRNVTWLPEMSTRVPLTARLIVPNIPLIGFASMLANASMFSNIALATLASYLDSKPFLNITVQEYLWGYEEPLVQLASNIFPTWIPFDTFGLLDRMFDDGENIVTMNLNMSSGVNDEGRLIAPLTIDKYNGSPGLHRWGYKEGNNQTHRRCNTLQGIATEGVLFPRSISKNDTFMVYRKAFCRTLPVVFEKKDLGSRGIPVYRYKLPDDVFDNSNPENSCYCEPEKAACLPRGLSDMTPCLYGIPAAVSLPHFYQSDPSLLKAVDGLAPVKEDHASKVIIQPDYGVPMEVHSRIQTNIVVRKTKYNPRVSAFDNLVVPIFWVDLCIEELPEHLLNLLTLLITLGPILVKVAEIGFAVIGLSMTLVSILVYVITTSVYRGRKPPGDNLWHYRSVRIVPVIRNEDYA